MLTREFMEFLPLRLRSAGVARDFVLSSLMLEALQQLLSHRAMNSYMRKGGKKVCAMFCQV